VRRATCFWAIEEKVIWVEDGRVITDWHVSCVLRFVRNARSALLKLNEKRQECDSEDGEDDWGRGPTETFYRLTRIAND